MTLRTDGGPSPATFRALVENGPDVVLLLDADGCVQYASRALEALTGETSPAVLGRPAAFLLHPDDAARAECVLADCLAHPGAVQRGELRLRHRDGYWVLAEGAASNALADPAVGAIVCTLRDVSERKRREEAQAKAQRLEAVARVAGGIAHDFNNLLGITLGYSEMILRRMPTEDPLRAKVAEIRRAAELAGGLTQQLMLFTRTRVVLTGSVDLGGLVEGMADLLRRTLGPGVELDLSLAPQSGHIRGDHAQLAQVLTNLASNARDAMPQGGRLSIECRPATPGESPGPEREVPDVVLAFRDTGVGMEPAVQERLFEPFFTTKPRAQAAGLGLATVHRIVTQSGGRIEVASVVHRGTTVKMVWPGLAISAEPATISAAAAESARRA
jgi:two-component system, cell cycle sensor histidine kinase and response regulator CckA